MFCEIWRVDKSVVFRLQKRTLWSLVTVQYGPCLLWMAPYQVLLLLSTRVKRWELSGCTTFKSLGHGRSGCDFENAIFVLVTVIGIFRISYDNTARWIPRDLADDESTLVQVMSWCRQTTSHYVSECWPTLYRHMASLGHNKLSLLTNLSFHTWN